MSRTEVIDVTGAIEAPPRPPAVEDPGRPVGIPIHQRILAAVDVADLFVGLGLVLWAIGFWPDLRLALGVPGAVLVLWALPPRPPFVRHEPSQERG